MGAARMGRGRRWAGRLLALGFGLTLMLLGSGAAELGYRRVSTGRWDLPRSADTWVRDPALLYRLNPANPDTPGSFRGAAPESPRRARYRVICLGGSTTFGHRIAAAEAWPAALQQELRARGVHAEVVNAGVPGYGSRQELVRYPLEIAPLAGDVVILYLGWNRTGALVDPRGWVPAGVPRPFDGRLAARWTQLQATAARHSLLLRQVVSRLDAARVEKRRLSWQDDGFERVWGEDVRALITEISARGQRPLVAIYPSLFYTGMGESEIALLGSHLWQGEEYRPGMLREMERKHALLRKIGADLGVTVADLQEALDGTVGEARLPLFFDQMHPSVEGNRWIAVQLAPLVASLCAAEPAVQEPGGADIEPVR